MGTVIWFLFVALITCVLERENLFPEACRALRAGYVWPEETNDTATEKGGYLK